MKSLLMFIAFAVCALPASAAEVYKCVDANGKVSYSSQKCPTAESSEKLKLNTRPASPAPTAADAENAQDTSGLDEKIANEKNPVAKAQLELRKQQCDLVKTQLQQYNDAPYLQRKDADGKTQRLSDEQAAAEKKKLSDYLAENCQ